jgi:hypothetical protein
MPLIPYFCWVGASLLVLLFYADSQLPKAEPRAEVPRQHNIRIAAKQTGPAAMSFSGHPVSYGPAPAMQVVDFAARAAQDKAANDKLARAREKVGDARQSLAQAEPEIKRQAAAKPAPQRARKRSYARRKVEPEEHYARRRIEAEQHYARRRLEAEQPYARRRIEREHPRLVENSRWSSWPGFQSGFQ